MEASELKRRLARTWMPFFARHGNFTSAQLAAMPALLAGHNVILCAGTASGKTETALAPLVERHLPPLRPNHRLVILYLLPTRALIADLQQRLQPPMDALRVTLAVKTRDLTTFDPQRPADLLLTTPESLDALLAAQPAVLRHVAAVVLDELHAYDGAARGDQLRVVLNRLRQVRRHAATAGENEREAIQYVALSATLPDPAAAAARYFPAAQAVVVPGARRVVLEMQALDADTPEALLAVLRSFPERSWRKALAFCNTRAEVEAYAAAVRAAGSVFGHAVFVHYSNLDAGRRRAIEAEFAQAPAALCFASSTLELGIDVGNIDVVLLLGAPGSVAAFVQRVGRGGRRQAVARTFCFYRTPLEALLYRALEAGAPSEAPTAAFRPSVAVQQIFSLLKQSPTGSVRLAQVTALLEGMLPAARIEALLGHLQEHEYLAAGRMGEWRPGARLNRLVDQQSSEHAPLSLYSNIQNRPATLQLRDQQSQQLLANVDRLWLEREQLTLEGRPLDVAWFDGEALWVTPHRGATAHTQLPYLSARQVLSFDLAQQLPAQLGLAPATAALVEDAEGWLFWHWLGDVYGQALLALWRPHLPATESSQPGLCLRLAEAPQRLPEVTATQVTHYLAGAYRQYETGLELGAYQHLLPRDLRRQAVVDQFGAERFVAAIQRLQLTVAPESVAASLQNLLGDAPA